MDKYLKLWVHNHDLMVEYPSSGTPVILRSPLSEGGLEKAINLLRKKEFHHPNGHSLERKEAKVPQFSEQSKANAREIMRRRGML